MIKKTISSNLEDYLEAIAELVELNGHAHTKAIAEKLRITMPSVTNALQTLATLGLVSYQSHTPVTLTAAGAQRAAVIRNRHLAMRIFFSNVLKLDSMEADEVACKVEHVISEKVLSRFVFLAEAITKRDDCRNLRLFLEKVMPQLHSDEDDEDDLIPLPQLNEGKQAIVERIDESLKRRKKFADLGLADGTLLQMVGPTKDGKGFNIKVLYSQLTIRSQDASLIWVKPAEM